MPTTPLLLGLERSLPSTSPFFHPTQPLAAAAESSTLPLLPHLLLCAKAAAKSHPSSPPRSSLAATTIASHPLSIAASAKALRRRCRHMFGVEAPSQEDEVSATRSHPRWRRSSGWGIGNEILFQDDGVHGESPAVQGGEEQRQRRRVAAPPVVSLLRAGTRRLCFGSWLGLVPGRLGLEAQRLCRGLVAWAGPVCGSLWRLQPRSHPAQGQYFPQTFGLCQLILPPMTSKIVLFTLLLPPKPSLNPFTK